MSNDGFTIPVIKHLDDIFNIPEANNLQVGFAIKKEYIQEDLTNNIKYEDNPEFNPGNVDITHSLSPALSAAEDLLNKNRTIKYPQEINQSSNQIPSNQLLFDGLPQNNMFNTGNKRINNAIPELNKLLDENVNGFIQNNKIENTNINNNNEKKFNIINLYWLLHECKDNFSHIPNYSDLLTISYNIDFGNLRLEMLKTNQNSFFNGCMFLNSSTRLINGVIYPATAFKIVNRYKQFIKAIEEKKELKTPIQINCIEELINNTNEQWQYERPIINVYFMYEQNIPGITIEIKSPITEQIYYYSLCDWQIDCFLNSLEFVYNDGFKLRGNKIINN